MKIWIWGTGQIASEILDNGVSGKVSGFIETNKTKENLRGYPVIYAADIRDFDYILVANCFADEIYDWCIAAQFDLQKVIFLFRGKKTSYVQPSDALKCFLGEKNYTNYQAQYEVYSDSFAEKDKILYQKLNHRKTLKFMKNICGR